MAVLHLDHQPEGYQPIPLCQNQILEVGANNFILVSIDTPSIAATRGFQIRLRNLDLNITKIDDQQDQIWIMFNAQSGSFSCEGDSGSPIVMELSEIEECLLAIQSVGTDIRVLSPNKFESSQSSLGISVQNPLIQKIVQGVSLSDPEKSAAMERVHQPFEWMSDEDLDAMKENPENIPDAPICSRSQPEVDFIRFL